jgi:hypothetical protein
MLSAGRFGGSPGGVFGQQWLDPAQDFPGASQNLTLREQ